VTGGPDSDTLHDRFRGALLGLAVGEALGAPAEFLTPKQIVERYGVITEMIGGGCHDVAPGEPTDATEMMLCLAESLADNGDFDAEDVMERYRVWFESSPRDVSLTVRIVMLSYRAGTPWDVASRRAFEILGRPAAANGSLMRTAPIALRFITDDQQRREVSQLESTLTHFERLAGASCAAFNDLLAAAVRDEFHAQFEAIAAVYDDEDRRVSDTLREAVDADPEEILSTTFVLDTLRTALWAVLRSASFEDALCLTVNLGNDADSVGAVTGALAGAVYGQANIPARWLEQLLLRDRIVAVADRLAALALASA
jgi:ADP-ribosyl-[dinitrogen reductase] hydrolase